MYMAVPETNEDIAFSDAIANCKTTFSDPEANISNADKWAHAKKVFNADPDATLFSALPYEQIYQMDDPVKSEATAFVADLRCQYLQRKLDERFTPELHILYLRNVQWMVKLREQSRMKHIQKILRSAKLH